MEQHVEGKNTTCLISYVGLIVPILPHLINICAKCAKFKACFRSSVTNLLFFEGYGNSCVQAGVQQPPWCKQGFRKQFLKGVVWNGFFHTFFSLQSSSSKYRTRLEKISHGSKTVWIVMHKAYCNNWGNSNDVFESCLVLGTTEYTSLFILWLKTGTFMGIGSAACFLVCSKKRDQSFLKKKYIFYSKTDPLNSFH